MNLAGLSVAAGIVLMLILAFPFSLALIPIAFFVIANRKR